MSLITSSVSTGLIIGPAFGGESFVEDFCSLIDLGWRLMIQVDSYQLSLTLYSCGVQAGNIYTLYN